MNIFKKIFFIYLLFFCHTSKSIEIISIVKINENTITNIDLMKEVKFLETLNGRKINEKNKINILQNMIDEKIKYLETQKNNISVNKKIVEERVNFNIEKYNDDIKNSKEILNYIKKKIEISMKWNALITSLYARKLEINTNEIKEIVNSKKKVTNEEDVIRLEKEKKINILSKTYFNEVKKNYYIKYNR